MTFTPGELLHSLSDLALPEQVTVIEKHIEEHGLHQGADVISMLMLNILLELDGGQYSDELKQRVENLMTKVREFNEARFKWVQQALETGELGRLWLAPIPEGKAG